MDDQRQADALTDEALDGDLSRALAVDPSPEFVARVRTRIASEPAQSRFAALKGCATSEEWPWPTSGKGRRAFLARRSAHGAKAAALRPWTRRLAGATVVAAAAILAAVVVRPDRSTAPTIAPPLAARAIGTESASLPSVGSGFSRTVSAPRKSLGPPKGGPHVLPKTIRAAVADPAPLFDPRETRALRLLIAGVRDSRVDLTPLLQPGAPSPMELTPVDDLVIAPLAIEPIAPVDGAQGARQ